MEETNKFKGFRSDRVSEELWIEVHKNFSGGSDQNHPPKKEVVVGGGLTKS